MTFGDYLARCIALHYQTGIGMIGAVITAAATLILCADLSAEKATPDPYHRRQGVVTLDTWAGRIEVEGLGEVVAPAVDAIQTSNRIEARQNHETWPKLPADPEAYR